MKRSTNFLGIALLAAACSDDGTNSTGTDVTGATLTTLTAGTTQASASTADATTTPVPTTSATVTDSGSGSATAAMTTSTTNPVTSTSEPSTSEPSSTGISAGTASGTSTGAETGSSSSTTGPQQLCSPGATQCADETNFETCADDGLAWQGPTPCGGKLVCLGDTCISKCEIAKNALSSVGCEYYGVDTNNDPVENYDAQPYAVAVSNVDKALTADVQIQVHDGVKWNTIQSAQVTPKQLKQFDLPDRHVNYTNINKRGAYKIISDIPIIAYQFQPINGQSSFTSDASLLLPVASLDTFYYVLGWGEPSFGNAQVNIVASAEDTQVTITPNTVTVAGGGIPALAANQPALLPKMNEGDVIQIEANALFAGTYITSDKPISVFSAHWCANVPDQVCCCDHLEEQVYGLQKWGTTYVASRWPVRNNGAPEASYWHVIASEDATKLTYIAHAEVTGLGAAPVMLNKGQVATLAVSGTIANPGDFVIDADKPIFVMQYLSSSAKTNAAVDKAADPAMAQAIPSEQYRSDYVVLVPTAWNYDWFVITKKIGTAVTIDGVAVPPASFVKVGPANNPSEWEVARVAVADGVHALDGDQPFGVIVLGYDSYDSYAYPGGLDQKVINPQ